MNETILSVIGAVVFVALVVFGIIADELDQRESAALDPRSPPR